MDTQVRTPQMVFTQPQRLVVPLFQRPYVWNQESQWEPLWNDLLRVADRLLKKPEEKPQPHFLGAVVLQQAQNPIGLMQVRTIIDGQQRLTTLQLLLDALHAELLAADARIPAARLEPLVANAAPFCAAPEDRFKVWPTNRDRPAFNAVMGAPPPVDHDALAHRGERMVEAHRFFSEQAREWLAAFEDVERRAAAIETVARDFLQMVVIDLTADENAQEIFETLNARGSQLTAADLIKNFIFQRLSETGSNVELEYQDHWRSFETAFWESEVNVGRIRYPRSSLFLNHWLVARTGEEVVAREVFERFKRFADQDVQDSMSDLLNQVHRASRVYEHFVSAASLHTGSVSRLGLFGYRTGVLESEVIKPLVLCLLDPEEPQVPDPQVVKALDVTESWMVRRMLVRASTKDYNHVVAELVAALRMVPRERAGDAIQEYFVKQSGASRYWPDDAEVSEELASMLAYRRLSRGRLRMVLEAVEDHLRGWKDGQPGLGGERVARGQYVIEHVMPRKWTTHWEPPDKDSAVEERERLIHTFGNLTLLTSRLNSKVSNGPWQGEEGKRRGIERHDVLFLNRDLLKQAPDRWTDDAIRARTRDLTEAILKIWPVPAGHRSGFVSDRPKRRHRIHLSDLLSADILKAGMFLFPRRIQYADRITTLLPDGRIDVNGEPFASPSDAATYITGRRTNGWWFFYIDRQSKRTLRSVRLEYGTAMSVEAEDDVPGEEGEEDD